MISSEYPSTGRAFKYAIYKKIMYTKMKLSTEK
jgi:hypothetical protein